MQYKMICGGIKKTCNIHNFFEIIKIEIWDTFVFVYHDRQNSASVCDENIKIS